MQQVALQCQPALGADDVVQGGCTLQQAMQLCAAMPASVDSPAQQQQWLQEAAAIAVAGPSEPDNDVLSAMDAVSCLLECYGASTPYELLEGVRASLGAAESLSAVLQLGGGSDTGDDGPV